MQEKYLPEWPAGGYKHVFGIAHYVYDPLTFRWRLIQRWGLGSERQDFTQQAPIIEPYVQIEDAVSQQGAVLEQLERAAPPVLDKQQLVCAGPGQINEQIANWRQELRSGS